MRVFVCLSVRVSQTCERTDTQMSQQSQVQISLNVLYMLPAMTVARFSRFDYAIRGVLPAWWMTSFFPHN